MSASIRLSLLASTVLAFVLRTPPAPAQPLGPEFRINSFPTGIQGSPRIATDTAGNFVVVWRSDAQDGSATASSLSVTAARAGRSARSFG